MAAIAGSRGLPLTRLQFYMATREELHRRVDALSEAQVERARIVILNEVDGESSLESILARHGERRLSAEEFEEHFGDLPHEG